MALCTDDRNPLDIGEEGHLDFMIRTLIALGRPRHAVYRAASFSAATAFGLRDRGLVAPGWRADIVLLERSRRMPRRAGDRRRARWSTTRFSMRESRFRRSGSTA